MTLSRPLANITKKSATNAPFFAVLLHLVLVQKHIIFMHHNAPYNQGDTIKMEPFDLLQWRHANKMTKTALAKALGMHRNTIERWESGEARMPVGLRARLDMLATAKQAASMPDLVTPSTAKHRPDLRLYASILTSTHGRATYRDAEHPGRLLPHLAPPEGKPYPWDVLDSDEYKTALAEHRAAQIHKRAHATPAALTALMERGIAEQSS